jgi:hypothetical protein
MNVPLMVIGLVLVVLSFCLILVGSFYSKKTVSKSSTKPKFGRCEYAFLTLRLQYDSRIEGVISVSLGELSFALEDFFGWIPSTEFAWVSGKYARWEGHGEGKFQGSLNSGDYVFVFRRKSEKVDAELKYQVTYYIHKLKSLVDLGLAFVEVSVPLLVTGLVLS